MQKNHWLGLVAFTVAAVSGTGQLGISASSEKIAIPVVSGATSLSATEKGAVDGECGCGVTDTKPGYGFGTTGHYGPPGQGFTPSNSWRRHVARGDTTTPKGNDLPPRAYK